MSNETNYTTIGMEFNPGYQPTVTMWNRIEGRPRKNDFNRALRAEIRDPLWMLTKQWQTGEFEGDDAGSPILAKALLKKERLSKYKSALGEVERYCNNIPLEGLVEQLPLPFFQNGKEALLDIRIMMGRYWLKLIGANRIESKNYASAYPIVSPDFSVSNDVDLLKLNNPDDILLAHPIAKQKFAAVSGWCVDGYLLYENLKKGLEETPELDDRAKISQYGQKFMDWVDQFFLQPSDPEKTAYLPSRMEYQFKCAAPDNGKDKVFEAEEFYSGRLDWFNFSINEKEDDLGTPEDNDDDVKYEGKIVNNDLFNKNVFTFLPVNIDYAGMPDTRWWKFEDKNTYLGDIKPDTVEVSKLIFLEFSLLYANDWFILPQQLPAASTSKIKGLVVTNCFGERTWIGATGEGPDDDWTRWTMYTINLKGKDLKDSDDSLILLPTVPKIQESEPMERIVLIRDEIANMVWAIETDISLLSGDRIKGTEAARELKSLYDQISVGKENSEDGDQEAIRYKIMNTVPENWIPFIPVHLDDEKREIQLQRASMPRIIPGKDEYDPVKPRTSLIRYGLEKDPAEPYFIFEEEVPRAGISVHKTFQRTRWYGGKVFSWLGLHKKTGRGEGSSGLRFDYLE